MKKTLTLVSILLLLLTACSEKNIMADQPNFDKKDHHFITDSYTAVMSDIEAKKEGIYYFGNATCPVCEDLVPVLEDVLTELDQEAIYINVSKEEFSSIAERFEEFDQSLAPALQSEGGIPYLVAIDDKGTVRTHRGTISSYDIGKEEMSEDQIQYLEIKLKQAITGE